MNPRPIKCASKEFYKSSFYLIQRDGAAKRWVVSLRDKGQIKKLLCSFSESPDTVLMIKVCDLSKEEQPVEYVGELTGKELSDALEEFDEVIFHHSLHDFMIKDPRSGDYFAFDEHGLIYIYSDLNYSSKLEFLGAEFRPNEKLIFEFGHWHILPKDPENMFQRMITSLKLTRI